MRHFFGETKSLNWGRLVPVSESLGEPAYGSQILVPTRAFFSFLPLLYSPRFKPRGLCGPEMVKNAALGTSRPEPERTSSPVGPMARDVKLVVNVTFCFLLNHHRISSAALAIEIRYPRAITSRRNV